MPYNKVALSRDLTARLNEGLDLRDIARWALDVYNEKDDAEPEVDSVLMKLVAMEEGPEFEMTKDQLRALAARLIADEP